MKNKFTVVFCGFLAFLCLFNNSLLGQDLHFTQFPLSPLTLSTANAGDFYGTYRVGGIFRSQFNGTSGVKGYSTMLGYVDAPLPWAFRSQDWLGLGIIYANDKAGIGGLGRSEFLVNVAYHLAFDKSGKNHLSLGYQTGSIGLKLLDPSKLVFYDLTSGLINSDDINLINQKKSSFTEHAASAHLQLSLSSRVRMKFGFTMAHLGKPKAVVTTQGNFRLPQRQTYFGQLDILLTKSLALYPALIYQVSAKQKEFGAHALASYQLQKENNLRVNAGLGLRQGDSYQFLAGFDYKTIKFGAAFDITSSLLRPNNGIELGISYIGRIFKTPNPKQVIICPRF
ncbi:MAG: PorP/SprF family type IX secretion system membrane protein [Saprospiraceae bacterium]|nr:PorP/SprF family type IX secretion system membrane protein [Saprospiraceae bacterium]